MRSLLDVNVLLALLDADHADHHRATEWADAGLVDGWASCAITENGVVRVLSQPSYPSPVPVAQAVELLERSISAGNHERWPCTVSLLDPAAVDRTRLHGPRQLTDTYLLALAVAHDGRLVTFDRGVVLAAVPRAARANLQVL